MLRFSKSLKVVFEKCECITSRCAVNGLMKCTVCNDILKSAFGKKGCVKDGKKPAMIKPAARCANDPRCQRFVSDAWQSPSVAPSLPHYYSDSVHLPTFSALSTTL